MKTLLTQRRRIGSHHEDVTVMGRGYRDQAFRDQCSHVATRAYWSASPEPPR
jgi:hypothetical protein